MTQRVASILIAAAACAVGIAIGLAIRGPRTPDSRTSVAAPGLVLPRWTPGELACPGCNLVIIDLTNLRQDHLTAYGYARPTTPNLERFFADALVFQDTFAPASWTLPVATSLHTSLQPYTHGLMSRDDKPRLSDEVVPLSSLMKPAGYASAGFTGGADYSRIYNFSRGYDVYLDEASFAAHGILSRDARPNAGPSAYVGVEELVPWAVKWVDENRSRRMFLLLQGYDVHCPFTPSPPYDTMFGPPYAGALDFTVVRLPARSSTVTARPNVPPRSPAVTRCDQIAPRPESTAFPKSGAPSATSVAAPSVSSATARTVRFALSPTGDGGLRDTSSAVRRGGSKSYTTEPSAAVAALPAASTTRATMGFGPEPSVADTAWV